MAAARRWLLFALSLASLSAMSYAGVVLAFSVRVTPEMVEANPDLTQGGRAVLVRVADPALVRTHADSGEGALLVAGERSGSLFASGATGVTMARALLYVDASAASANVTLIGVPARDGATDLTLDPTQLSNGTAGWVVMGSGESAPRFFAQHAVLGEVSRFASATTLGATFAAGLLGFLLPLVAVVVTHKPSGRRGAPEIACRECGSPMQGGADFCLRCGAYRAGE